MEGLQAVVLFFDVLRGVVVIATGGGGGGGGGKTDAGFLSVDGAELNTLSSELNELR